MRSIKIYVLLLVLLGGLIFGGCGKKSQPESELKDDLFVEYHEYYFPQKIETLALGDLVHYKGRSSFAFSKNSRRKRFDDDDMSIPLKKDLPGSRRQLLRYAQSAIGTPYVVGGMSPGGFDCSGLVCWAYGNVGVKLPRTAREQSVVGRRVVRQEDMQSGDIVAFRHPTRGYHTGIYLGGGKFIHSPRRRSHVKINSLDDDYFKKTFLGARRVNIGSRENLLAQAENRLRDDFVGYPSANLREDSRVSRNASRERYSRRSLRSSEKKERAKERERMSKKERLLEEKLVAYNKKSNLSERDKKRLSKLEERYDRKESKRASESRRGLESKRNGKDRSDSKERFDKKNKKMNLHAEVQSRSEKKDRKEKKEKSDKSEKRKKKK